MKPKRVITDALEIMEAHFPSTPEDKVEMEQIRADDAIARKIYELRTKAGLSQRQLAKLIGATPEVIASVEDADYEGHMLAMLNRVAAALDQRVEIRSVRLRSPRTPQPGAPKLAKA